MSRFFARKEEKVKVSIESIYQGHHQITYRGVKAIRCPFDYLIYQMIISEVKPDLVIEIGTNMGGGALYIADLLEIIGNGVVHTIDITEKSHPVLGDHPRIRLFTKGWENYNVNECSGYKNILVIEDASHMYEDTLKALKKFAPLVSKGSYLIVEDGIINELGMAKQYSGGPLKAIREFLKNNSEFEVERRWCDMFGKNATFNVNGYLKKLG